VTYAFAALKDYPQNRVEFGRNGVEGGGVFFWGCVVAARNETSFASYVFNHFSVNIYIYIYAHIHIYT